MAYGLLSPRRGRSPSLVDSFFPSRDLHNRISRMFGDSWPDLDVPALKELEGLTTITPKVDISETDGDIKITAELPGIDEKDVDVSVTDNMLTIKGEKKAERDEEKENLHIVERSYGSFLRSFTLPSEVDQNKIDAKFEKGVLTITLPKTAAAKELVKKIAVKAK